MSNQLFSCFLITIALSFGFCVTCTGVLIPLLQKRKLGQKILEIGPQWHKVKEGTPTMGGIAFLITFLLCNFFVFFIPSWKKTLFSDPYLILTLLFAILNGMVGLLDDSIKFFRKENQGLTAKAKFFLQVLVASGYLFSLSYLGLIRTTLTLPFLHMQIDLGIWYYIFALFLLIGFVNSVNLTDGIDGLASGVTLTVGAAFAFLSLRLESFVGLYLSALIMGICVGFLLYNAHPAKIFMGDTGSLFLGGLVVGIAFYLDVPLLIFFVGLFYFIEATSVILQVLFYKWKHKRLFLMAPFHHHLEKKGYSEEKIVFTAIFLTIISSIFSYFGV